MEGAARIGVQHTRDKARLLATTCARWAGLHFHGVSHFLADLEFPRSAGAGGRLGYDGFVFGVLIVLEGSQRHWCAVRGSNSRP